MSKSIKASYSGESTFKKKNHYKLKDGDVVFRIVPPMSKFTDDPKGWSRFHSVHFGYKNSEGKLRMFESTQVKDHKENKVLVEDPALNRLNELKERLEKAQAEGNTAVAAKLSTLVGFKGIYSIDKNHHMNVIGLDGGIGELKIRHKAKQALDAEITKLRAKGIDPLSEDDGRFFVFSRFGLNRDTNFKVSVYSVDVDMSNGGTASQQLSHKITPELWNRLETEAFDLDNIFNKVTVDEITQIVKESDLLTGKSPACDRIFDARWKSEKASTQDSDSPEANYVPPAAVVKTPNSTPTVSPNVLTTSHHVNVVHQALKAENATAVAPKAVVAQSVEELSDDDFFAQIGVKNN